MLTKSNFGSYSSRCYKVIFYDPFVSSTLQLQHYALRTADGSQDINAYRALRE